MVLIIKFKSSTNDIWPYNIKYAPAYFSSPLIVCDHRNRGQHLSDDYLNALSLSLFALPSFFFSLRICVFVRVCVYVLKLKLQTKYNDKLKEKICDCCCCKFVENNFWMKLKCWFKFNVRVWTIMTIVRCINGHGHHHRPGHLPCLSVCSAHYLSLIIARKKMCKD